MRTCAPRVWGRLFLGFLSNYDQSGIVNQPPVLSAPAQYGSFLNLPCDGFFPLDAGFRSPVMVSKILFFFFLRKNVYDAQKKGGYIFFQKKNLQFSTKF